VATTKKALAMADELVSELNQRQSALAVSQSYDTDGSPLVKVGSGVAGTKGGLIKIMPISWPLAKDVLGLSAEIFTPHVVRLNVEANYAGANDNIADINTWVEQLLLVSACVTKGARTEVYLSTNGTGPNATDINDATKLVASFEPNMQYPMISSQ
jgi:hypothetical protein